MSGWAGVRGSEWVEHWNKKNSFSADIWVGEESEQFL